MNMRKVYCHICNGQREAKVIQREENFKVRGESISVLSAVLICGHCNEEIFSEELDTKNIEAAYNKYRKKHNLLFPSDIRRLREKYNLSQRALGKLLEWGEVTINRYESGGIQDAVHDEVLRLIDNPDNMVTFYEKNSAALPVYAKVRLKQRIDELVREEAEPKFNVDIENILTNKPMSEFSGYRQFDLDKFKQFLLFFTQEEGVFPTKLNKLLWYADFLHFKVFSTSITGSEYVHIIHGPVPDEHELIRAIMVRSGMIQGEEVCFPDYAGEKYKAISEFDSSFFSINELKVMGFVKKHFQKDNCSAIRDKSHKEKPYKNTAMNQKISYKFASDLSLEIKI